MTLTSVTSSPEAAKASQLNGSGESVKGAQSMIHGGVHPSKVLKQSACLSGVPATLLEQSQQLRRITLSGKSVQ